MKLLSTIIAISGLVFVMGCGKKDEDKGATAGKPAAGAAAKSAPAAPAAAAAKPSPAMMAFMSDLKGKSDDVAAALKVHGAPELESDMKMYDLREPKVVKVEGACETMEAKAGMTVRTFIVCWKDGKIASIENKGMR